MRSRRWTFAAGMCAALACAKDAPTGVAVVPPTVPEYSVYPHTVLIGGTPFLQVDMTLTNRTSTRFYYASGGDCPLTVRLVPDSASGKLGAVDGSMACTAPTGLSELSPGQTRTYSTLVAGDSLTTTARPGVYAVIAALTMRDSVTGGEVATITLPLIAAK